MQVLPACQASIRVWVEVVSARNQPGMKAKVRREQELFTQRTERRCGLLFESVLPTPAGALHQFTLSVLRASLHKLYLPPSPNT